MGYLAFVSLLPLVLAFSADRIRDTFWGAIGFGIAFFSLLLMWIRIFGNLAFASLVIQQTLMLAGGLVLARAILFGLGSGVGEGWRRATFAPAFLAVEYLRSHIPYGGFPWGGLGYSQHDSEWMLRSAAYGGVWGITLLLAAANSTVAELFVRARKRKRAAVVPLLSVAALLVSTAFLPVSEPLGEPLRLAMVQGNAPEGLDDPHADDLTVFANHVRLTEALTPGEVSLVVWPESSIDQDPASHPEFGVPLREIVLQTGAHFLVGTTIILPGDRFWNTSIFISPDGEEAGRYIKMRLVPFGEFVPARSLFEPWVEELRQVPLDGVPGSAPTVFQVPEGKFGSVICFESTFPGFVREFVKRGAGFLVVSTNNSSFQRSHASRQHLAFSQLRAAEHRMWVAHTALTGISAVISPDGSILENTDLFEPALLTPTVRMATTRTAYGRFGDWVAYTSIAVVLAGGGVGFIRRRTTRSVR